MTSELTQTFDQARVHIKGKELDHLREEYYIQAKMRGSDDSSIGGINVNQSGRHDTALLDEKKKKQQADDLILLAMLDDQIAKIEADLADKYGEDFAEQLAADLLNDDVYERLMKIDDKTARRRAIAEAIHEGLKNGTIDPNHMPINEDFDRWLDAHAAKRMALANVVEEPKTKVTNRDIEKGFSVDSGSTETAALDALFKPQG